jgi:hypothetical protein
MTVPFNTPRNVTMSKKKVIQPAAEDQVEPTTEQETAQPVTTEATTPAERPVKAVWRVCREMHEKNPEVKRSEVVAACIAIGINKHTITTQIQRFKTAQKAKQ